MAAKEQDPEAITRRARARMDAILANVVPSDNERSSYVTRHRKSVDHWEQVCPERYRNADLASLERLLEDPEPFPLSLYKSVIGWLGDSPEDTPQANVLIAGTIGVGKSWLASVLCRETAHRFDWWNDFIYADRLFEECRNSNSERSGGLGALDRYVKTHLLVVDDLGAGRPVLTEFEESKLSLLMQERWLQQRLTIMTTNLDTDTFKTYIGPRVYDRLRDPVLVLKVPGKSRRNQQGNQS